jgi:hypothetical protein
LANLEEWPEITEENWYLMAATIAQTKFSEFGGVVALCNRKLTSAHADMGFPGRVAAMTLRSPPRGNDLPSTPPPLPRYCGPPPPPPPPIGMNTRPAATLLPTTEDIVFDTIFEC